MYLLKYNETCSQLIYTKMGVYFHEIIPLSIISILYIYILRSMETYASSSTSYLFNIDISVSITIFKKLKIFWDQKYSLNIVRAEPFF